MTPAALAAAAPARPDPAQPAAAAARCWHRWLGSLPRRGTRVLESLTHSLTPDNLLTSVPHTTPDHCSTPVHLLTAAHTMARPLTAAHLWIPAQLISDHCSPPVRLLTAADCVTIARALTADPRLTFVHCAITAHLLSLDHLWRWVAMCCTGHRAGTRPATKTRHQCLFLRCGCCWRLTGGVLAVTLAATAVVAVNGCA